MVDSFYIQISHIDKHMAITKKLFMIKIKPYLENPYLYKDKEKLKKLVS